MGYRLAIFPRTSPRLRLLSPDAATYTAAPTSTAIRASAAPIAPMTVVPTGVEDGRRRPERGDARLLDSEPSSYVGDHGRFAAPGSCIKSRQRQPVPTGNPEVLTLEFEQSERFDDLVSEP